MTIQSAYLSFLDKVNKNLTNDNISADVGRFISLFNEEQNKFVEWVLKKRNEDEIREVQRLLVSDKELDFKERNLNHKSFKLPSNFFSFSNIQAFASSSNCTNEKLFLFEVKQENVEELLADKFNKPSFKYRETFYLLSSDAVKIYIDNFDINKVYLTYYRYPNRVDMKGYIREDNTHSVDIDPEFDDKVVDRIITACAKSYNVNNDNLQKYQVDRDRIYSKI